MSLKELNTGTVLRPKKERAKPHRSTALPGEDAPPDSRKIEFKVYLNPDEAANMRAFCASRSIPMSVFMRQVIVRFIDRQLALAMTRAQEQVRQSKIDEALARLDTI